MKENLLKKTLIKEKLIYTLYIFSNLGKSKGFYVKAINLIPID